MVQSGWPAVGRVTSTPQNPGCFATSSFRPSCHSAHASSQSSFTGCPMMTVASWPPVVSALMGCLADDSRSVRVLVRTEVPSLVGRLRQLGPELLDLDAPLLVGKPEVLVLEGVVEADGAGRRQVVGEVHLVDARPVDRAHAHRARRATD